VPGQNPVAFDEVRGGTRDDLRVTEWVKTQELRAGKVTLWDHCFELPGKNLQAQKPIQECVQVGRVAHKLKVGGNERLELFDYPGGFAQRFDGIDKNGGERPAELPKIYEDNQRVAAIRMQQEAAGSVLIQGAGNCAHFVAGHKFTLEGHYHGD